MTQKLSKEYYLYMNFVENHLTKLENLNFRLSNEWQYEKEQIAEVLRQMMEELGPTISIIKGQKIIISTELGNDRVGQLEMTRTKYSYGVIRKGILIQKV